MVKNIFIICNWDRALGCIEIQKQKQKNFLFLFLISLSDDPRSKSSLAAGVDSVFRVTRFFSAPSRPGGQAAGSTSALRASSSDRARFKSPSTAGVRSVCEIASRCSALPSPFCVTGASRSMVDEHKVETASTSAVLPLLFMKSGEAPLERRKATASSAAPNAAAMSGVFPPRLFS